MISFVIVCISFDWFCYLLQLACWNNG